MALGGEAVHLRLSHVTNQRPLTGESQTSFGNNTITWRPGHGHWHCVVLILFQIWLSKPKWQYHYLPLCWCSCEAILKPVHKKTTRRIQCTDLSIQCHLYDFLSVASCTCSFLSVVVQCVNLQDLSASLFITSALMWLKHRRRVLKLTVL